MVLLQQFCIQYFLQFCIQFYIQFCIQYFLQQWKWKADREHDATNTTEDVYGQEWLTEWNGCTSASADPC